ncbi:MAG: SufE family protein [Verrucomicrobiaceae bacterium]|nr:MAG: SufE family protein [Verrucomicrobiaceae bacterium]
MIPPVPPALREEELKQDFLPVSDPQERLALLVDACAGGGIPAAGRQDADLVPGCVSRVWLRGSRTDDGRLYLAWDADSPLVRGLAGLICRIYDGAPLEGIAGFRSSILETLKLDRQLSPTRLRGLHAVENRIHRLASETGSGA